MVWSEPKYEHRTCEVTCPTCGEIAVSTFYFPPGIKEMPTFRVCRNCTPRVRFTKAQRFDYEKPPSQGHGAKVSPISAEEYNAIREYLARPETQSRTGEQGRREDLWVKVKEEIARQELPLLRADFKEAEEAYRALVLSPDLAANLTDCERHALKGTYDQVSYRELARTLGISKTEVARIVIKGREKLKAAIEAWGTVKGFSMVPAGVTSAQWDMIVRSNFEAHDQDGYHNSPQGSTDEK